MPSIIQSSNAHKCLLDSPKCVSQFSNKPMEQMTSMCDMIDSLLDEFAGELTLLKSIPQGIDDDNLDPEGEIHLVKRLLYDNSSPCPPKEFNSENPTESFSPSPIPVKDNDSLWRRVDFFLRDYIEVESTRILATLSPVIKNLLAFSSKNEDKVFNYSVLASKEKSPSSPSYRGLKAFQLSPENPMLIHGNNTLNLGDYLDCDDSRARGFCPSITRASHLQLHFGNDIAKS
ncbi:hypothetical protein Tco_1502484 [Tanacetum coccineum]